MGTWKQKRSRKAITLEEAKLRMTDAIKQMEKIILDGDYEQKTVQTKIQAVHALSGIVSRYAKLVEIEDLESRISALEENRMKKVS